MELWQHLQNTQLATLLAFNLILTMSSQFLYESRNRLTHLPGISHCQPAKEQKATGGRAHCPQQGPTSFSFTPKETHPRNLLFCILGLPHLQAPLTYWLVHELNITRWQCPTEFMLKPFLCSQLNSQDILAVHCCFRQRMQVSNQVPILVPKRIKPKHSSFRAELENYWFPCQAQHVETIMQNLTFSFRIRQWESHWTLS